MELIQVVPTVATGAAPDDGRVCPDGERGRGSKGKTATRMTNGDEVQRKIIGRERNPTPNFWLWIPCYE
jgi:hypothetical protein